jgi:DNA repair photolyase
MPYTRIIRQSDLFPETVAPCVDPRKVCKYIYEPKFLAFEYATLTCNPYTGCGFRCSYCSVPMITQHQNSRAKFDAGAVEKSDFLKGVALDARRYAEAGITDQVLLSFASDPYPPVADTTLTRKVIETIIAYQTLGFGVLTKAGERSLRDLDLFRPTMDFYAQTMISVDDAFTRKWELNTPLPGERIAVLRIVHDKYGIFIWISIEPVIDPEHALAVVRATYPFVHHYKIGPLNYFPEVVKDVNWRDFVLRMVDLLTKVGRTAYFKKELQRYLPKGYPNPMRIPQHF